MKKILLLMVVLCGLFLLPELAIADDYAGPIDLVGAALQQSTLSVMNQLNGIAFNILYGLSMLKFIIMGYGQFKNGEIETLINKLAFGFIWVGFVVYLMNPAANPVSPGLSNGGNFIQGTVDYFLNFASKLSGGTGSSFNSGDIMNVGLTASHNLIVSVATAMTSNVGNVVTAVVLPETTLFTALMLMLMNLLILASCAYIALKIFMVKIEVSLVICISPLSFALAGLDALREQGLAPFKNMLTIVYRIVILAAIVASMKIVSDNLVQVLTANSNGGMTDVWTPIAAAIFGYILLGFLAHKSDGIAASLSSGSSMFGSGDVASSAAMGAAIGAAVVSGGTSVAAGAAKGGQSMGNFIKENIPGGSRGSISNFSDVGSGGDAPTRSSSSAPMSSLATSSVDSGAPVRSNANATPEKTTPIGANNSSAPTRGSQKSSGADAGISGAGNPMEQKLDKVLKTLGQQGNNSPTFGQRISALNDHVAKEQTTVNSSVNLNAHDH